MGFASSNLVIGRRTAIICLLFLDLKKNLASRGGDGETTHKIRTVTQSQENTHLFLSDLVEVEVVWVEGLGESLHVSWRPSVGEPLWISLEMMRWKREVEGGGGRERRRGEEEERGGRGRRKGEEEGEGRSSLMDRPTSLMKLGGRRS